MKTVKVKGFVRVRDNGVTHAPGEVFEMEESMALAHEKAGQVKILGDAEIAGTDEPEEADASGEADAPDEA